MFAGEKERQGWGRSVLLEPYSETREACCGITPARRLMHARSTCHQTIHKKKAAVKEAAKKAKEAKKKAEKVKEEHLKE
eukprot:1541183-Rhodomonas_salina.3